MEKGRSYRKIGRVLYENMSGAAARTGKVTY